MTGECFPEFPFVVHPCVPAYALALVVVAFITLHLEWRQQALRVGGVWQVQHVRHGDGLLC